MATVTGFTAERMLEIENTTVVDAHIDGSGHFILETRDGTMIDTGVYPPAAPDWANIANKPTVFPTNWASISDPLVKNGGTLDGSSAPGTYPIGITVGLAGSNFPSASGTVQVIRIDNDHAVQYFYEAASPNRVLHRFASANVWGSWRRFVDPRILGASIDLNTITDSGTYIQTANANATTPLNYPAARAGYLEVISNNPSSGVGILQRYTDYDGTTPRVWVRMWYNSWSAWSLIVGEDPLGFESMSAYLASGVIYAADADGTIAGLKARRVGRQVELVMANVQVATLSIPVDGNIANTNLLAAIPTKFRPAAPVSISGGWAGRSWNGYIHPNGNVIMAAVTPNATSTGTETLTNGIFSGSATYLAATP